MSKIGDFIDLNKFVHCPIGYDDKDYDAPPNWENQTYEKLKELKTDNKNGFKIDTLSGENKYIVLDTDDETSNKFILSMNKKFNLNTVSSPSYHNITDKKSFRNHYWYKIDDDYDFDDILFKDHLMYGSLDIIHEVAEHKSSKIDYI